MRALPADDRVETPSAQDAAHHAAAIQKAFAFAEWQFVGITQRKAMANIEARPPALSRQVETILRIVWVASAGKNTRSVINGFAESVRA